MSRKTLSREVVYYVLDRDGNSCIMCGSTDGIQLAHIKSRGSRPDLINDPDNIACLCFICHMQRMHTEGSITRETLENKMEELYGENDGREFQSQ